MVRVYLDKKQKGMASLVQGGERMCRRIGHRGTAGHEPENTLRSIRRAIDLKADLAEIDVQRTADKHLVLLHDKRVDRTTDGRGYLADLTLDDLRTLDAGAGERVPTLAEVLKLASGRIGLLIELIVPGIAADVVAVVDESGFVGDLIYASFHHSELLEIRALVPKAATLALLEGVPVRQTAFTKDCQATHVGLAVDSITEEFVRNLQADGLCVFVYTVNDSRDVKWLQDLGVDGIISDYPDRLTDH